MLLMCTLHSSLVRASGVYKKPDQFMFWTDWCISRDLVHVLCLTFRGFGHMPTKSKQFLCSWLQVPHGTFHAMMSRVMTNTKGSSLP